MYNYDSRFVTLNCFIESTVSSIIYRCYEKKEEPVEALIHAYNLLDNNSNQEETYEEPKVLKSKFNDLRQLKNKDPELIAKFYSEDAKVEATELLKEKNYLKISFVRLMNITRHYAGTEYSGYSSSSARETLKRIILKHKEKHNKI